MNTQTYSESPIKYTFKGTRSIKVSNDIKKLTTTSSQLSDVTEFTINEDSKIEEIPSFKYLSTSGENLSKINTVKIQSNKITQINDDVFSNCYELTSITIPNSITKIGNNSFFGCSNLSSIEAQKISSIGNRTFKNCINLKTINLPDLRYIGNSSFEMVNKNKSKLEQINISNVKTIGYYAFMKCDSLTSLTANNAEEIGEAAFAQTGLISVELEKLSVVNSLLFSECDLLTVAIIPNVTQIHFGSFDGCSKLSDIYILNVDNPPILEEVTAFSDLPSNFNIHVKNEQVYNKFIVADNWKDISQHITYEGKDTLLIKSFNGDVKVPYKDITQPLKYVDINGNVLSPFNQYPNINNKDYITGFEDTQNKLTSIGENCFYNCSNLTSVSIPSIETIEVSAFKNCTNLEQITCENATSIGQYAFEKCESLKSINIPNVSNINYHTFNKCIDLTGITISNVQTISQSSFSNCSSLKQITANNATTIGQTAFDGCTNLNTVNFPEVTEIDDKAFRDCENLEYVYINKIEKIKNYVFATNKKLKAIYMNDVQKVPDIKDDTFRLLLSQAQYYYNIITCYVPDYLITDFEYAINWSTYLSRNVIKFVSV